MTPTQAATLTAGDRIVCPSSDGTELYGGKVTFQGLSLCQIEWDVGKSKMYWHDKMERFEKETA